MTNLFIWTGRLYNGYQTLQITVEDERLDEWDMRVITATFRDDSRGISGRVETLLFGDEIGPAVLKAYDRGDYITL